MPNKVYKVDETAIVWTDTTGDLAITLNNLAAGAGRQGAQKDLGVGSTARARRYRWRFVCQFATTPVLLEAVHIYLKQGDGTDYDNDDGTGDIAVSAEDKLNNLTPIGVLVVDQASTAVDMSVGGVIEIDERYVMPVIWNDTADNLVATNNVNTFTLTPIPPEMQ